MIIVPQLAIIRLTKAKQFRRKGETIMTTKFFRDFCSGVTAKITTHNDGTATLKVSYWKKAKRYKSYASAYNAWYRLCN